MTIPERRFLQASLVLPLVAPLAFLPMAYAFPNSLWALLAGMGFMSLLYGGVPYLIFASSVLFFTRDRPTSSLIWVAWRMPPLFGLFAGLLVGAVMGWSTPRDRSQAAAVFGGLSFIYSVVFGYAYVALALGGRSALKRAGILSPDPDDLKGERVPRRREALG